MKKLVIILFQVFYFLTCLNAQEININSTFSKDTIIYPFNGISQSCGLKISGNINLISDTSLIRTILITNSGAEFMVYEAYPLIVQDSSFEIIDVCDETCFMDSIVPTALRVEIIDAKMTIYNATTSPIGIQNATILQFQEKQKKDLAKIEILKDNLTDMNFAWTPGNNDVVKWTYSQKKTYWGEKYNLLGYDYYSGGIYQSPGVEYATITYNPYVDVWDWRNRHGANDPGSPYFDDDYEKFTGWLTSVKNQSDPAGCGSCAAFAVFGSFEALINLYYNQHLDIDLSEQEQLSCNPLVSCSGGHPNAIFPYIQTNSVLTEECFPYLADDAIQCNDENYQCENPETTVSLSQYEEHTEGNFSWNQIQEMLITKGPLAWIKNGGQHAIAIIGYIYDDQYEKLYLIQKESLGEDWGFNKNGILIEPAPVNYLYVGVALDATVTSTNSPTVLVKDEDDDGYDNWGIGPRPDGASTFNDCDDSNPSFSTFDSEYACNCVGEYSPDEIVINNGDNIFWSNNMVLNEDVIVKYGGKLTITAKILIHKYVDFIVEPGGQLFIDGGHLTKACDDFWKGIEIWGDINKPQINPQTPSNIYSNQGRISITNGGILEYAKIGILTGEFDDYDTYDYNKSGGIIKAVDAVFRNNEKGIKFLPYYDEISVLNWSVISNCTFITYDDQVTLFPFKVHLIIDGIYGLSIKGSDFIFKYNQVISTLSDDKGIGIFANNSHFTVGPICTNYGNEPPCNEYDKSSFVDLRYGIKAFNTGSNNIPIIYESIFDSCVAGIYLSGYSRAEITSNRFNTQFADKPENEEFYGGLYLEGCTGYHIENNTFFANYQPYVYPYDKAIGMYIKDSGEEDNEVYDNYFHNLDIGIIAEGTNKGQTSGLTIKCNTMFDNGNDIFVIPNPDVMIPLQYQGIKYMQGTDSELSNHLAGNTFTNWFSGTPPNGESVFWNYKNNLDHFDYFHHLYQLYPLTSPLEDNYTDETITLDENENIPYLKTDACPTRIGSGGTATTRMATTDLNIAIYESQLSSLTDGGDTEASNDSIIFSIPGEGIELRNQLLSESPYLSDTVMKSAIAKEEVLLNAMLRDVLVANPQSAKKDEILDAAENRVDPMPGYMMNEIMEGLDIIGAKELLESKLGYWKSEYHRAINDLARGFLADSTNPAPFDSLLLLLENEDDLLSKYNLAFAYLDKRDTLEAISLITGLPADFEMNSYQTLMHGAYEDYFDIIGEMYSKNLNAIQLDSSAVVALKGIKDMHVPRVSAYATGLLVSGGHIDYTERIALPGTKKASRFYPDDRPDLLGLKGNKLQLMPNPTRDYVVIGYNLNLEKDQGIILIRDAKGTLVKNLGLHKQENEITVDLKAIPSGMYIVSLYAGNSHIESKQLSISR